MWGFITVMNDVLINSFDDLFQLNARELSLIQVSFFGTFFVFSLLYFLISSVSGKDPVNRIGYKVGMSISLFICVLGCVIAYVASLHVSYYQFLIAIVFLGMGVTFLQICANPYATILGPESSASSRLNLAQGLNSLGTTIAPIIGSIFIYGVYSADGEKSVESIGLTYLTYAAVFALLAVLVLFSKLPPFQNKDKIEKGFGVLKNRHLRFGIIAIFIYVGSEVAIGSWFGKFATEDHIMGLDDHTSNYFLSFFWGGLMIGRMMASTSLNDKLSNNSKYVFMAITSILVFTVVWLVTAAHIAVKSGAPTLEFSPLELKQIWIYLIFMGINYAAFIVGKGNASKMIVIFCSINAVLLSIGILSSGELAFWSILGTGLFFSIGWSNIFTLSIKGLGIHTSQGSSLLVMAIVGGAVLPFIQSQVIDSTNVQTSFVIPLIGMFYLIFFGLYGYRRKDPAETPQNQ